MTWKQVLVQGLIEGSVLGLLVGGVFALVLGMWVLGPLLLGASIVALQLSNKAGGK